MPNPLKYVSAFTETSGHNLRFGADALDNRPALCLVLMQILVEWSMLEQRLAESLAHTLSTQPDMGVEIYLSLEHNAAQLKVIRDTAAMVLDDADLALFDAILVLVRRGGKERNTVAHGIWGSTDKIPNGLVLLQRKEMTRLAGPLSAYMQKTLAKSEQVELLIARLIKENSYIDLINESLVYSVDDFAQTRKSIKNTADFLYRFWQMKGSFGPERETLRRTLCDEPAIQEVLCRPSKDQTVPA
jgi:hypothetical protein